MSIAINTAPCCWGVDDVRIPNLPPWGHVLDEDAAAAYGGYELCPFGSMPLDVTRVRAAREPTVVAGTNFDEPVRDGVGRDRARRHSLALGTALPHPASRPASKARWGRKPHPLGRRGRSLGRRSVIGSSADARDHRSVGLRR